jgi:DNA gyrase subunit A
LCHSFDLSEEQARAILAMRLGRLTQLETDDLKRQLAELRKLIRDLESILASESRQLEVLVAELDSVVSKFGDDRRTTIVEDVAAFEVEDLVAEEQVVITLSHQSYIKSVPIGLYRRRVSSGGRWPAWTGTRTIFSSTSSSPARRTRSCSSRSRARRMPSQ